MKKRITAKKVKKSKKRRKKGRRKSVGHMKPREQRR